MVAFGLSGSTMAMVAGNFTSPSGSTRAMVLNLMTSSAAMVSETALTSLGARMSVSRDSMSAPRCLSLHATPWASVTSESNVTAMALRNTAERALMGESRIVDPRSAVAHILARSACVLCSRASCRWSRNPTLPS